MADSKTTVPNAQAVPISPCRLAFESWAMRNKVPVTGWQGGGYVEDMTAIAWAAWKAGRVWADSIREETQDA